jgi:hypothetical protein
MSSKFNLVVMSLITCLTISQNGWAQGQKKLIAKAAPKKLWFRHLFRPIWRAKAKRLGHNPSNAAS